MDIGACVLLCVFVIQSSAWAKRCSNVNPCQIKTGESLRHPAQLLSRKNHLEVTLNVQMSKVTVGGWLDLWRRTYNGQMGGPTWRVKPGDTITVNLINTLGPNAPDNFQNKLRLANSTNLYLHGLHVSPQFNDATERVDPGEMRKYTYKIDCNHPSGTYWYHPNVQGSTMFQTLSGMAGMIVVEDNPTQPADSILSLSCPKNCDREIHLLFQPTMLYKPGEDSFSFSKVQKRIRDDDAFRNRQGLPDGSILDEWLVNPGNNVKYFTTNGQIQPTIRIEAGKTMRLRMVNAGGIHVIEIDIPKNQRGDSCVVQEIARDGLYLAHPRELALGRSILPQGGTIDWLIRCDAPGSYNIASNPRSRHGSILGKVVRFRGVLANMEVAWGKLNYKKSFLLAKFEERVPMVLPAPPKYMPNLMNVVQQRVDGKFVVEAAGNNLLNREKYLQSENIVRHKMPLDSVQEWTLLNADPSKAHTLHIQGNHFQVISYNKYVGPISITNAEENHNFLDQRGYFCKNLQSTGPRIHAPKLFAMKKVGIRRDKYSPYNGNGFAHAGDWRNTIILPPLSNVTVRLLPRHFTGRFMVHSHNLLRKDLGMKLVVEVIEKGKVTTGTVAPGKSGLPGTCRPGDFYPKVSKPGISVGRETLRDFLTWLYTTKPLYKKKYGDQRYLSSLYGAFLKQLDVEVTDGSHLQNFFHWVYGKFPSYKSYYGDQSYLHELYDYYLVTIVEPRSVKKNLR